MSWSLTAKCLPACNLLRCVSEKKATIHICVCMDVCINIYIYIIIYILYYIYIYIAFPKHPVAESLPIIHHESHPYMSLLCCHNLRSSCFIFIKGRTASYHWLATIASKYHFESRETTSSSSPSFLSHWKYSSMLQPGAIQKNEWTTSLRLLVVTLR